MGDTLTTLTDKQLQDIGAIGGFNYPDKGIVAPDKGIFQDGGFRIPDGLKKGAVQWASEIMNAVSKLKGDDGQPLKVEDTTQFHAAFGMTDKTTATPEQKKEELAAYLIAIASTHQMQAGLSAGPDGGQPHVSTEFVNKIDATDYQKAALAKREVFDMGKAIAAQNGLAGLTFTDATPEMITKQIVRDAQKDHIAVNFR